MAWLVGHSLLRRLTNLAARRVNVAVHTWVVGNDGLALEYLCWCKRKSLERENFNGSLKWPLVMKMKKHSVELGAPPMEEINSYFVTMEAKDEKFSH
ncbi:hypothetical protein VNO77_02495 [Canavalia gladiata]|uniref:Uncharacterized protein n=1 Tax=Canavalia gladiata TaxID=3824 RepID=A0AAN9RBC6_CANGL